MRRYLMAEQNKHGYFKQIAGRRVERILEALDALGNCSSPVTYAYGGTTRENEVNQN